MAALSASELQERKKMKKRNASTAGLSTNPNRIVKRRASKACQCCRARKVRCNVVEHGAPCTNCRLDEVECIVAESKRRKKFWDKSEAKPTSSPEGSVNGSFRSASESFPVCMEASSVSPRSSTHMSFDTDRNQGQHVPHLLYQTRQQRLSLQEQNLEIPMNGPVTSSGSVPRATSFAAPDPVFEDVFGPQLQFTSPPSGSSLPNYIKPFPPRVDADDIQYLQTKGALVIPDTPLRDALLRSYFEYVHGYMPLLDIHEFLGALDPAGFQGKSKLSLLLFQAVMFAGTAFVDMDFLLAAGFSSRKAARKSFFQRARLLYDFDYETDRLPLTQALLLMTYWYETPDDQKDTWHWMGLAISMSHTLGLHRNHTRSKLDPKKKSLYKRIWWSCFMRDRLVAIGMRRPTRIKHDDYDVSMLSLDDFNFAPLPTWFCQAAPECSLAVDTEKQRQLATMCIEKAKLCLCISHVLGTQYSVLNGHQSVQYESGTSRSTIMLFPKKLDPETQEVRVCDMELKGWQKNLPEAAKYRSPAVDYLPPGERPLVLHRALLHMIYYTTVSALHRPQVLPSGPSGAPTRPEVSRFQDDSRRKVRMSATEITRVAGELYALDLVRYLPTTGVTVLLPAVIIHLLDIKSLDEPTRRVSLQGFYQCMQVLRQLRDNYAAAEFSTMFLEAAVRKADIQLAPGSGSSQKLSQRANLGKLVKAGKTAISVASQAANLTLTPPPEVSNGVSDRVDPESVSAFASDAEQHATHDSMAGEVEFVLSSTPPSSEHLDNERLSGEKPTFQPRFDNCLAGSEFTPAPLMANTATLFDNEVDGDFESLLDLDHGTNSLFHGTDSSAIHGESSGFTFDMDWMNDIQPNSTDGFDGIVLAV
ncbi:hypothetical protein L228DRAFT_264886 [Xylona heveae TC161]|uniref:Zn(2)-C6 fungal-type domain-containing protein n=1 Tax=Xylona heveae (strain CBS 132557 / TC161) TaxID=1328760 RepID=A0A165JQ26_XYLHT|nr:hypothetical protein L228DRAFT_264886 [Xylona heveae TC161]KZF26500.1 hypothetical protein L228DRAFT_264886 [Xylona heveae TC161]